MITKNVAKRYGRAFFRLAVEDGQFDLYREQMEAFVGLWKEHSGLRRFFLNPVFSEAERLDVVTFLLQRLKISEKLSNFLTLLVTSRRIDLIEDILASYQDLVDEFMGRVRVSVWAAAVLSEELQEELRNNLERLTGKKVDMVMNYDPSLLGGMIVQIGDVRYDGSIKTQLKILKEELLVS